VSAETLGRADSASTRVSPRGLRPPRRPEATLGSGVGWLASLGCGLWVERQELGTGRWGALCSLPGGPVCGLWTCF